MREKIIKILADCNCNAEYCKDCEFANDIDGCVRRQKEIIADRLIANGVVPVVRCKDCKCWNAYGINGKVRFGRCKRMVSITKVDDFCSYGERKDKELCG